MSPSSVTPFLRDVPDLFPPSAFDPPPVTRPPPDPPADWISFPPKDGPSSFDEFRGSPLFQCTRDQILDRLADCETFTHAHFSAGEAAQMLDGFQAFRRNLIHEDGDAFFAQGLPNLYGYGKRHFDGFCLRLAQDDLDLDQRKTALRELAQQLHFCGSTGPAFLTAYLMLDRAQGGLHSEFHDALLTRMEALLVEFVNQDPPGSDLSPESVFKRQAWREQMEVHMVNRLKLELGLPGGNSLDHFSFGTHIHMPDQTPRCKAFLKQHLRPTVLARDLAERYVARLREALPEPLRDPDADLSDVTELIRPAHTRLNATFGPVALQHLLTEDEATGQTRWQSDVALVALDVLTALEQLGLVVRPAPTALMHGEEDHWKWELLHVDWQLFFVHERWPPATEPVPVPVQLRHLRSLVASSPPSSSTVGPLVDAVLRSEPPIRLMEIPPQWLSTQDQMRVQLQTLGSARSIEWLSQHAAHGLAEPVLRRLLPVLTELGMGEVLGQVLTPIERFSPRTWMTLAGGLDVLHRSMRQGDARCQSLWCSVLDAARGELSGADIEQAFLVPGQPSLVTQAMLSDSDVLLKPLLGLLVEVRRADRIDNAALIRMVEVPIQHAMARGLITPLTAYGASLKQMAMSCWLSSHDLRRLLEGPVRGAGCGGAMVAGQTQVVRWLHRWVAELFRGHLLSREDARAISAGEGAPGEDSAAMKAVRAYRPRSLAVHLKALLDDVRTGLLPAAWLPRLLACRAGDGQSALGLMLGEHRTHPCLGPWRAAVGHACQEHQLSRTALRGLLTAPDGAGTPFLRDLIRHAGDYVRAIEWLETVKCFQDLNRLEQADVVELLEGRGPRQLGQQESVLHAAMTTWNLTAAVSFMFSLYGRANALQMVSNTALEQLLKAGRAGDPQRSALWSAVGFQQTIRLKEYLTELRWLFHHGAIDAPARWRLLDGRSDGGQSALAWAVDADHPQAVVALLHESLEAAQQQQITGEDWCLTLLATQQTGGRAARVVGGVVGGAVGGAVGGRAGPAVRDGGAGSADGSGALDRLRPLPGRARPNPEILLAFVHALDLASSRGLLTGPRGAEVLQRWRLLRPSMETLEAMAPLRIHAVDADMDDENGPPTTPPQGPTQA